MKLKAETYSLTVQPLYKGSANPPTEKSVLLKTINGVWGIGIAYKDRSGVYFEFYSPSHRWSGEPKSSFVAWMPFPDKKGRQTKK